jgi:hypothetical protein
MMLCASSLQRTVKLTLLCITAFMALVLWSSPVLGESGPGHVGVLVQFGDGRVLTRYLELETPVDRLTVLEASGLAFETAFGGDAVCKIDEEGCRGTDTECWCRCPFTAEEPCFFWIYLPISESGDQWGDMNTWPLPDLDDGDVSAWVWGEVDVSTEQWAPLVEAPFVSLAEMEQRALTPGEVTTTGGTEEVDVTATFSGDSDKTASASARFRLLGDTWSEPQPMVPGESHFAFAVHGLQPGEYEVQVVYLDDLSGISSGDGSVSYEAPAVQTTVGGSTATPAGESTEPPVAEDLGGPSIASRLGDYATSLELGGLAFGAILVALLVVYLRKRPR